MSQSDDETRTQTDYDSVLYKFQLQIIGAWKPIPNIQSNFILYGVLTILCVGLGVLMLASAPSSKKIDIRYDNQCSLGVTNCQVSFTLTEAMNGDLYAYYSFEGFYQNHRLYINYFSQDQLQSAIQFSAADVTTFCGQKYITNGDLGFTTGLTGLPLTQTDVAFPCGPIAKVYNSLRPEINSFKLLKADNSQVAFTRSNIAWPVDIGRHKDWNLAKQAFSVTEEDWLVWFRPSATRKAIKRFATISGGLPAGDYKFSFSQFVDSSFGEKRFQIISCNFLGEYDIFLGVAFLVLGGICAILTFIFAGRLVTKIIEKEKKTDVVTSSTKAK